MVRKFIFCDRNSSAFNASWKALSFGISATQEPHQVPQKSTKVHLYRQVCANRISCIVILFRTEVYNISSSLLSETSSRKKQQGSIEQSHKLVYKSML